MRRAAPSCETKPENLAVAFWERIGRELPAGSLRSLRLWESDKNWVEVGERV